MKAMDMKSRIELELRGKEASTIKELNLDSCRGQQIEGLSEEFQSLEILSLINVGLTNLKGFPRLGSLRKLELSDNRISSGLDHLLTACPNLTHLNLSNNKIKELDVLAPLAKLDKLTHLDLFHCEVTNVADYRDQVFKLLPQLHYLDGFDSNEQEEEEEDQGNEDEEDDEEDEDEEEGAQNGEQEEDDDEDEVEATGEWHEGDGDEDDDEEDEDEAEEGDEVGLSYLQKSNLQDEEDDEEFDTNNLEEVEDDDVDEDDDDVDDDDDELDDDDDEDDDEDEGGDDGAAVSLKRKREDDDDDDDDDDEGEDE